MYLLLEEAYKSAIYRKDLSVISINLVPIV